MKPFWDKTVSIDHNEIIDKAKCYIPEVFEVILEKSGLTEEQIRHEDPDYFCLLDLFGIDYLIEFNGQRYAIDLTIGTRATVKIKRSKMRSRLEFYKALNAIPVVLRSASGLLPENICTYIEQSVISDGIVDCRLSTDLELEANSFESLRKYEVDLNREDTIQLAEESIRDIFESLVEAKYRGPEATYFDIAHTTEIFELLMPDMLIEVDGERFAINHLLGTKSSIDLKRLKMEERMPFYKALNATPVVLNSESGLIPDNIIEAIKSSLSVNGVKICKVGEKHVG